MFYPDIGRPRSDALEACKRCVVKDECLDEAIRIELNHGLQRRYGYFGGMSATERYHETQRRIAAGIIDPLP